MSDPRKQVRSRAIERCRERGVVIPTLAEQRDPETMSGHVEDRPQGENEPGNP